MKYLLTLPGVNKTKCGIRKFGKCFMNPVMQCLLMAETRDTQLMLTTILQAGPMANVNFTRKDGASWLEQALMLKHPEYTKLLLSRNDLIVDSCKTEDTPLHLAIKYNRVTHTRHLLDDKRVPINEAKPEPPMVTAASSLMLYAYDNRSRRRS